MSALIALGALVGVAGTANAYNPGTPFTIVAASPVPAPRDLARRASRQKDHPQFMPGAVRAYSPAVDGAHTPMPVRAKGQWTHCQKGSWETASA